MCVFIKYPKDGYMALGSLLFLKEQIKDIIIICSTFDKTCAEIRRV